MATDGAEVWRSYDLDGRRTSMKECRLEMVRRAEDSKTSRKTVAIATRKFRSLPKEEQGSEIKGLVRLYQGEIDSLTKRAKAAEAGFLDVFTGLFSAPDPTALIDAAVAKASRRELKLEAALAAAAAASAQSSSSMSSGDEAKLHAQIASYEAELSGLRDQTQTIRRLQAELDSKARLTAQVTQYESELGKLKDQTITIRRLQEQLNEAEAKAVEGGADFEAQLEAVADAQHAETAAALNAEHEAERSALEARNEASERNARSALDEVARLQAQLDATVVDAERAGAAHEATATMLASEVQRLGSELAISDAERRALQQQAGGAGSGSGSGLRGLSSADADERLSLAMDLEEAELKIQSMQAAQRAVVAEAEAAQHDAKEVARAAEKEAAAACAELALMRSRVDADELSGAASGKRLRLRVRAMKQLLLRSGNGDGGGNGNGGASLASSAELAALREALIGADDEDDDAGDGFDSSDAGGASYGEAGVEDAIAEGEWLRDAVERRLRVADDAATMLRLKLEETTAQLAAASARAAAAEEAGKDQAELAAQLEIHLQMTLGKGRGSTESVATGLERPASPEELAGGGGRLSSTAEVAAADSESSMLAILTQQRDRFKAQMLAETTRAEAQRKLHDAATQRAVKFERDNVALYEKIRFLQAWKPKHGGGGGGNRRGGGGGGAAGMSASKEAAYGEMYAAGLDPFAAFKKRERDTSSTWVERRLVGALASRRFREVAALYLMLLHGICYFLLFYYSHSCDGGGAESHHPTLAVRSGGIQGGNRLHHRRKL